MPRGRRPSTTKTLDEQILEIDAEIEALKGKINAAKEKKKALEERKQQEDIAALLNVIKESGKTPAEFLALFKEKETA